MTKSNKRAKTETSFDAKAALDALEAQWKGGLRIHKEKIKGTSMATVTAYLVKIWTSIELLELHFGRKAGIKADPTDTLQRIVNDMADARDFSKKILTMLLGRSSHRDKTAFIVAMGRSLNVPKALGPKQSPDALVYIHFTANKLLQEYMQQKRGIPTLAEIRSHATLHYEKHYGEHGLTLTKEKWKAASKYLGLSKMFPRQKAGRPKVR
jgi:hypothetical protein